MNGAMHINGPMQCGPMHSVNGMMANNNPNLPHHQDMGHINMPKNNLSASTLYSSTNPTSARMRPSGYSAAQQQFPATQKRGTHQHQYSVSNGNASFSNSPTNALQTSYVPQGQAHFNSNQVGVNF